MPIPPLIPMSHNSSISQGLTVSNQNSARLRFNQATFVNTKTGSGWTSQRSDNKEKAAQELFYESLYVDGLLRKKRKIENSQAG